MRRTVVVCAVAWLVGLFGGMAPAAHAGEGGSGGAGGALHARSEGGRTGPGAPAVNCSTPLRLHDGSYQTGTTVSVYARGLWVDLGTFGFDNRTSSYTVGACAVELASGSGGSGSHYTRCLYAGCVEDLMATGWNNVVSSVYLH